MSGNKKIFNDKNINNSNFCKNKKPSKMILIKLIKLILIKYHFLKKNHMVIKIHLNTSLDIMIAGSLDHVRIMKIHC